MSTIEKMSVQGIRSFGHEETDKQMIKFYTPLTLILGPNGTGKTTIIECLKYMTTGVMPPGAAKGGAFVHDPKIANEREVKGQVRLQFKDLCRKTVVAQRSINCSIKGKKTEMKTLDGVLTRLNAAGEKQSITSKCADMDREMITSLGVSKAVLENVIFCHQEEANWPLSEGKQLKEKFDAIFASTRYVKALENIKKVKKEQDEKLKTYKEVILYLRQNKDKSLQFQCDLTEQEGKLEASKASVEKYKKDLEPIEVKLNTIEVQSAEIFEIRNEITQLTSRMKEIEKHAEELQQQIKNEFQGTDDELKRTLEEFKDKLEERQYTLKEFEKRNADLARQEEKVQKEKSAIFTEVGRLEQEAERQEENVKKRDKLIHEYAREYDFDGLSGMITDDEYQLFLKNLQKKLDSMMTNTRDIKVPVFQGWAEQGILTASDGLRYTSYEEEETKLQVKIDDLRDTKTQLEQSERMKKNMMSENSSKIKDINRKLSEIEASGARLDQLKRELKRHEHDMETKENAVNTDDLKQEIANMNKEKSKLDSQISDLSSEMNQLTLQSNAQAQLDVLKRDKSAKEECIRQMKAKHEDTVKHLFGHVPGRNIRVDLEEYIGKQSVDVRKCSAEMNQAKNNLSKLETQRKMNMETLKQKENEMRGIEERIYTVCGSQNFDEGLETIQEKMDKANYQRGSLLGAEHFFKKYTDDLDKENPGCPLCRRAFETEQEVRDLISDLNKKLRMVPSKLEKAEKDIEQFQEKYESLLKLQPLKENIMSLEKNDIPKLKNTLKKCQDEIQKLTEKVADLEDDLSMKEADEGMAKDIHPDIVVMDRYYGEITELDKKIAVQASKLTGGDSGRTLQMVIDEKDDLQMKVDSLSRRLDQKRQKLTDHSDQVQVLRATINSLREEKLSIENDLQQRIKLEEDKLNLETENQNHQQEIKEAVERIRPLQANMDKLRGEKDNVILEKDDKVEAAKAEVEIVKGHATKVRNINQEIKKYNQSGKADSLRESLARKDELEVKSEKLGDERKDIEANIDKLRKDLSNQKVRELDLQSNMTLRGKKKECDTLSRKIDKLQGKLGDIDVAFLSREKRQLETQVENLTKELHTAEGRQRGFEDQIKAIRKELNSDAYKDAEQKYREKQIDFRTTELAIGDLERYSKALDRAIMNYHNLKMEEINKIIRELWRNTYKGNDIETIEIRSDEDEGDIIKTRKVYNYRVVMIKPGGAVIDMRGRCSAGQKVLASLIIRLALAETFCLNCGILALDEPTTNLDRENIESLACGLVEIIKARSHQRNFQLVVITHDEDFVELLGRSEYVDEFYRISKNQYGNSQITCSKVQALHA